MHNQSIIYIDIYMSIRIHIFYVALFHPLPEFIYGCHDFSFIAIKILYEKIMNINEVKFTMSGINQKLLSMQRNRKIQPIMRRQINQ